MLGEYHEERLYTKYQIASLGDKKKGIDDFRGGI